MNGPHQLDLEAYLARIGYTGPPEPALSTLRALHLAHLGRIPFENVDVRLGRRIGLDPAALEAKLVRGRRGGYCFEQNTLFAAVLKELGFPVSTLEARVRPPGATAPLPRTHMLLRVEADSGAWLADVGFGGDGPLFPVPLDGGLSGQPEGAYRVEREPGDVYLLRRRWRGRWSDLYAFTLRPALPIDFELAHHYTATHPHSIFVRTLTVQRSEPGARQILRGRLYTVRQGDAETVREVQDADLPALLRERFGLELPEDDVLRALGGPGSPGDRQP